MKTITILASLTTLSLGVALPHQHTTNPIEFGPAFSSTHQSKPAVFVTFYDKNDAPFKVGGFLLNGSTSDHVISGAVRAEIDHTSANIDTTKTRVVCTFSKNGSSAEAGEVEVGRPAVFAEGVKSITRTRCRVEDRGGV